ncbi:ankyrin repeat domain-containing protein 36C-like [Microplitis mediator]|uniref:ankyrin repeat domain-containing protein 36C-like n=1 Tax=Microplitis mediator TaxID=375433 RepID=UPI0025568068|nr:ankyrin repeat domain-containing protein 36C-like [Microplitis mediator]XP_057336452.1 ankyrin repeat domain-containing protein 36C-like [Microplitis mediator]
MNLDSAELPGVYFYRSLELAIEQNNKDKVELIIKKIVDVDTVAPEDSPTCIDSLLQIAIHKRKDKMVELLLKNNANPNVRIPMLEIPLMVATYQEDLRMMQLLIAYGANVNDLSERLEKKTSLHVAVQGYNVKVVELLLNDITIDVNITSANGNSVLHDAVERVIGIDITKHLLDAGVDINLKNHIGRTAFDSINFNSPKLTRTLKEHIVKLSAASFYVSEKNLALIADSEKLSEVRNKCMKEIENMKKKMIGSSNFTYYDLLRKCEHKLAVGLKHVPNNIILDLDIPSIFPLYGKMITYRLRRVLGRQNLLIDVTDLVYDIFNDIRLPSTFTSMIFKYLTNGDLKKLVI